MKTEDHKDNTQFYKGIDIELEHIPIQNNSKIFEPTIDFKIEEETKGQSNNNRDSLSKVTHQKEIEINSSQEDDIRVDYSDSKRNGFNKNESDEVLNVYLRSRLNTTIGNNLKIKKFC